MQKHMPTEKYFIFKDIVQVMGLDLFGLGKQ